MLQTKPLCPLLFLEFSVQILHGLLHFSVSSSTLYFPSQSGVTLQSPYLNLHIHQLRSWVMTNEDKTSLFPFGAVSGSVWSCATSLLDPSFLSVLWLSAVSLHHKYFPSLLSFLSLFPFRMHFSCWMWSMQASFRWGILGTACRISMETVMCTSLIPHGAHPVAGKC